MILLQSLVVPMAVTPILWALLMAYSKRPVSGAKARILPSSQAGKKGKQKAGKISVSYSLCRRLLSWVIRETRDWGAAVVIEGRGQSPTNCQESYPRFPWLPKLVTPGWGTWVALVESASMYTLLQWREVGVGRMRETSSHSPMSFKTCYIQLAVGYKAPG